MFDKEGEGQIGVSELGTVLRACGYCPTEEQINSFILQKGSSENSEIKVEDGGKKESEQTIVDPTGTGKVRTIIILKLRHNQTQTNIKMLIFKNSLINFKI